jgi:coenzyme F420 hydrogenase subunit beta
MTESRELYQRIIKNDYCIGCGVCASVKDSPFAMLMNDFGNIVADPLYDLDKSEVSVLNICPFSARAKNEDQISEIFFGDIKTKDAKIGRYIECFAGYVNEGAFREKGSSGGFGKWLGYTLLKENLVDFFVQVYSNQTNDPGKPLFEYKIVSDKDTVVSGSKSSYYPVTLIDIINIIKEREGRYAITGVPCFIKALRLLSLENEVVKTRIKYTIGIICGGMKSANQSKMIGWQLGVNPENLVAIDFRRKHKNKPAGFKIYQVWSNTDITERYKDAGEIYGTDWGSGYFKPYVCDYCDDVVGETADISLGDCWLPQFESDPDGTSIIIVRNTDILDLLQRSFGNKQISLQKLSPSDVEKSQEGGFRHRREALSFRIANKEASSQWYPPKRVVPNEFKITRKRKRIYSLREKIAAQSHISALRALNEGDINIFYREMNPLRKKYHSANYGSLPLRAFKKLKKMIFRT